MTGNGPSVAVKRWSGAAIIAGILALQLAAVWVLAAGRGQIGPTEIGLLLLLGATIVLSAALGARHQLLHRRLSHNAVLADDWLRLAMQSGKTVAWDWDIRTGRDVWTGDLKSMFGLSDDTYDGRVEDFRQRVHPDDREFVFRTV